MGKFSDLAAETLAACRHRGWLIATAESCTGGMVSAALTEVAGSSDVFDCGFTTYSNRAKQSMLAVGTRTLEKYGAVSEQVAAEMASGAVAHSAASLAVSITGIAGPGGAEHKPEGRVCFGLAREGQQPNTWTKEFGAIGRQQVREASVEFALQLLLKAAQK